jgi:GNAT superfamily N-acetyltransferase
MIAARASTTIAAEAGPVDVRPLAGLAPADHFRALAEIDAIFFEASSVQAFESQRKRFDFHRLWLGRYLVNEPREVFIALEGGKVIGYLVGSLGDPALRDAAMGLDYYMAFAPETARYPANLHVNVASGARNRGVGKDLVRTFERHAAAHGARGLHIITGAGLRNVAFYARLGFREVSRAPRGGGHVVMLAKALADA